MSGVLRITLFVQHHIGYPGSTTSHRIPVFSSDDHRGFDTVLVSFLHFNEGKKVLTV